MNFNVNAVSKRSDVSAYQTFKVQYLNSHFKYHFFSVIFYACCSPWSLC